MDNFKCCAACLVKNAKMFYLTAKPTKKSTYTLGQMFSRLLRIAAFEKFHYVCFECARMVCKFWNFKSRCQKAHSILISITDDPPEAIKEVIENMDCKILNLSSKLKFSSMITTNNMPDVETANKTLDALQELVSNKNNTTSVKQADKNTQTDENTLRRDIAKIIQEYESDIESYMSEEYLESDEDSFYSDCLESLNECNNTSDNIISGGESNVKPDINTSTKYYRISEPMTKDCKTLDFMRSLRDNEKSDTILTPKENNKSSNNIVLRNKVPIEMNYRNIAPDVETFIKTIDDTQRLELNNEVNKSDTSSVKQVDENTLKRDITNIIQKYECDDDSDTMIVEYLESEEDSFYSDSLESLNENTKDYNISESITEHQNNKVQLTETEPKARKRKIIENNDEKNHVGGESLSKMSKIPKEESVKKRHKDFDASFYKNYATVVSLTPEEAKTELLLRKESKNYKICPFKCEFCYRGFEIKATYDNHMEKHTAAYGNLECDLCHLRFTIKKSLSTHCLASHKRKFICKLCPYVCYASNQARLHVKLHKGHKYRCEECGAEFGMPNSLLNHKRKKHQKECVCEFCGDTFANERGIFTHNTKLHRQEVNNKQGPKCEECDVHFATEMAWKKHFVLSTKHNVSNGCKHCGETFANNEELKSHLKIHARDHSYRNTGSKYPMDCSYCKKSLAHCFEYNAHVMSEHPESVDAKKLAEEKNKPFVCEICGKMYTTGFILKSHQRVHTGERPYRCGDCGKAFARNHALALHRGAVHLRTRKHACKLCGQRFSTRVGHNRHVKIHLGIRPHKCALCHKSFVNPSDLKQHVDCSHNKMPWPKRKRKRTKENEL